MWTRRDLLSRSSLALLGLGGTCLGFAGDNVVPDPADDAGPGERIPDGSASKGLINIRTEQAIQRGLAYLNARRHRDGSFGTGQYHGNVAITSLAGMAFMCAGHQPNRGLYGKAILEALRFVMNKENTSGGNPGFLHNAAMPTHGPMYGHGFATLFLAEVYGMVHDRVLRDELREKLHRAVRLILDAQKRNHENAWRYTPISTDADLSVTICQIMALRSARNAGVSVPKSAVDKCTEYVKSCQDRMEGWFRYMKRVGGTAQQGFARTAAGICALNAAGIYKGPEIEKGLRFLRRPDVRPGAGGLGRPDIHYYYGHYY